MVDRNRCNSTTLRLTLLTNLNSVIDNATQHNRELRTQVSNTSKSALT